MEINDGSSLANLQVVLNADDLPNYDDLLKKINTGAAVEVVGTLIPSQGKGQHLEVQPSEVKVYGEADPETYPLQKKRHSFEFLRTIGHLRSRTNTLGAVFRVRNACAHAVHQFFQNRNFMWVHTPVITASDCEGAGELFSVTSLDLANVPRLDSEAIDYSQDFFGKPAYLTVSGQLEAEVMAMTFGNVYTFGPTLPRRKLQHLASPRRILDDRARSGFLRPQRQHGLSRRIPQILIFKTVLEQCPEDMEFFNKRIDNSVLATADNIINNEFERITYTEAINLLQKANRKFEFPTDWGVDLQSEHERYLAEELFKKPVIVSRLSPRNQSLLYAPQRRW
jgi:asparaginyl-tRNA synthetase